MSPCDRMLELVNGGFPRVSGDEPRGEKVAGAFFKFSPRERG